MFPMLAFPLVRFVIKAAVRDRLMIMMMVMIGLIVAVSNFLGSSAITEQQNFSQVFASGGLRLMGVIGLCVFIAFQVRRSFDNKEVEYFLSAPVKRTQYVFSMAFGFALLASALAFLIAAASGFMSPHIDSGFALWSVSYWVELLVVSNLTLFFAVILRSPAVTVMSSLGFYALARLIGTILGIIHSGSEGGGFVLSVLAKIMTGISMIIPRLDLMAQTSWLVYGVDMDPHDAVGYGFLLAQLVIFVGLTLCAALFDFQRKEF